MLCYILCLILVSISFSSFFLISSTDEVMIAGTINQVHVPCAMGNTVDKRSLNNGYSADAILAGKACSKHHMLTVRLLFSASAAFMWDSTKPASSSDCPTYSLEWVGQGFQEELGFTYW